MKTALALCATLMLVASAVAQSPYASCSDETHAGSGSQQTSWSCSLAVPSGGLVVATLICGGCSAAPTASASDSSGALSFAVAETHYYSDSIYMAIFSRSGEAANSADAVTVSIPAGAAYTGMMAESFSGYAALDATASTASSCGGCPINYSTSTANDLVYANFVLGSGTCVAGAGFTLAQQCDEALVASGVITGGSANIGWSGSYVGVLAAFAPASGAPSPPPCSTTITGAGVCSAPAPPAPGDVEISLGAPVAPPPGAPEIAPAGYDAAAWPWTGSHPTTGYGGSCDEIEWRGAPAASVERAPSAGGPWASIGLESSNGGGASPAWFCDFAVVAGQTYCYRACAAGETCSGAVCMEAL